MGQLEHHRMDLLYMKLNDVLELMADIEATIVDEWFDRYIVVLPLQVGKKDDIPF